MSCMRFFSTSLLLLAGAVPTLSGAEFLDIPGEGNLRCFPRDACPDSRGAVTSTPANLVSGSLLGAGPTLAVLLTTNPVFLIFSNGVAPFGPLGLDPAYQPESMRDSRIPVSGRRISLDLTNAGSALVSAVSLYLEIPQDVVTGPFPPQGDGLSFGIWCNAPLAEPRNCPEHIQLLEMPTGPGMLNPADITPSGVPTSTFGDLLRFNNVNLGVGQTARFTFFITDRKATLDPSTGGSIEGASASFNLEIVATSVPEPSTALLAAIVVVFGAFVRRRAMSR